MRAVLIFVPPLHEPPRRTNSSEPRNVRMATHGVFDRVTVAARDLFERSAVLLILPGEVDADLGPNEKMVH